MTIDFSLITRAVKLGLEVANESPMHRDVTVENFPIEAYERVPVLTFEFERAMNGWPISPKLPVRSPEGVPYGEYRVMIPGYGTTRYPRRLHVEC